MSNVDQLRRMLTVLQSSIDPAKSYTWSGASRNQAFEMSKRAAVIRQWEALHAIIKLADAGHGHFGVPFLRPAYEELIWFKYLLSVPKESSSIVTAMAATGVAKSVNQQAEYLGADVMCEIGWTGRSLAKYQRAYTGENKRLKIVGKRLGWPKTPPTFKWLSTTVGKEDEYGYIYHATSSFVHFSPHELLRRVWGHYGNVTIESSHFAKYWEEFAAYWAIHTFVQLISALGDVFPAEATEGDEALLEIIGELTPVPIVTMSELEGWPDPSSLETTANPATFKR